MFGYVGAPLLPNCCLRKSCFHARTTFLTIRPTFALHRQWRKRGRLLSMTGSSVEHKDDGSSGTTDKSVYSDADAHDSPQVGQPTSFRSMRIVLSLLSFAGCAESVYLTFNKVFSSPGAICPTQGCLDVLAGPFSTFLGIPISAFGALTYAVFGYLCLWPFSNAEEVQTKFVDSHPKATPEQIEAAVTEAYNHRDAISRPILLALSTAQFVFSAYLTTLMKFVIKSMCPFCLISAGISTLLFILTAFVGRAVPRLRSALSIGTGSAFTAVVASGLSLALAWPAHLHAQPPSELQSPPAITTKSTQDSIKIASKLREKGAKMYGAYWCAHCHDQKQRFGKKAFGMLEYIECDKYGVNTQHNLCIKKRIPGYPTWEIGGELFPGEIDIPELERLADESNAEIRN